MINSSYFEMKVKRNFLILKLKLIPIEIKLISIKCIPSKKKNLNFFQEFSLFNCKNGLLFTSN